MDVVQRLMPIYEEYIVRYRDAVSRDKPLAHLIGMASSSNDACHMDFYNKLKAELEAIRTEGITSEETEALFRFMFTFPGSEGVSRSVSFMMIAAQGLLCDFVSEMKAPQLAGVKELFEKLYKRLDRLPVQKTLYKAMEEGLKKRG